LKESKNYKGFMKNIKMIVFVKDSKKEICDSINKKLSKRQEILPCFA